MLFRPKHFNSEWHLIRIPHAFQPQPSQLGTSTPFFSLFLVPLPSGPPFSPGPEWFICSMCMNTWQLIVASFPPASACLQLRILPLLVSANPWISNSPSLGSLIWCQAHFLRIQEDLCRSLQHFGTFQLQNATLGTRNLCHPCRCLVFEWPVSPVNMRAPDDNPRSLLGSLPVFTWLTALSLKHSQHWPTCMPSEAEASFIERVSNYPGFPETKGVSKMQHWLLMLKLG